MLLAHVRMAAALRTFALRPWWPLVGQPNMIRYDQLLSSDGMTTMIRTAACVDGSSAVRGCSASLVALEETAVLCIDTQGYLDCLQLYRSQVGSTGSPSTLNYPSIVSSQSLLFLNYLSIVSSQSPSTLKYLSIVCETFGEGREGSEAVCLSSSSTWNSLACSLSCPCALLPKQFRHCQTLHACRASRSSAPSSVASLCCMDCGCRCVSSSLHFAH